MNPCVYLPNDDAATPLEGIKDITGDNTKHAIWTLMLSLLALITTFKRKSVMGQSYYLSAAVGRIITIISSRVVTPNKIVCLTH